jgi:hypothetical protein
MGLGDEKTIGSEAVISEPVTEQVSSSTKNDSMISNGNSVSNVVDTGSDGLRQRSGAPKENGSPKKKPILTGGIGFLNGFKKHLLGDDGFDEEKDEDARSDRTITPKKKAPKSFKGSPCHSWISNGSTNPYEGDYDEVDEEYDGGDIDDYEYDPYTHEYVPRIRDPPAGEDSDDGLLVSRAERDRSLSAIAHALLESARTNQEYYDKQKSHASESEGCVGGVGGGTLLERFLDLCSGTARLHRIEDMPQHLQFNKHIHSGYRELQDFWGCVFSLGYLHNETLNILTHGM